MQRTSRWTLGRILVATVIASFTVLLLGGYSLFKSQAPVPGTVATEDGAVVVTAAQIKGGQAVYQKYGLMDWGSVLGHGTYLGPDFTAEVLHRRVELLRDELARARFAKDYGALAADQQAGVAADATRIIKTNRYERATDRLTVSAPDAAAFERIAAEVRERFTKGEPRRGLPPRVVDGEHARDESGFVADGDVCRQLAAFFWWTGWLAGVERPEGGSTYTNNWPHDADAGNTPSAGATIWSGVSVAVLLLVLPLVLLAWFRGRYVMEDGFEPGKFPSTDPTWLPVHPSQRKAIKYFVVSGALFLLQTLLGGYMAHTYVEGTQFYGLDVGSFLPFVVAKTWHLQLAVFWIAAAWLGMGIYVAPLIGGREPKHQGLLVDILFGALVAVVLGSLAGEYLGVTGRLGSWWWILGHSGWEILEMGKLWQVLLAVGFALWIVIVVRALKDSFKTDRASGGLVKLFAMAAVAIPLMFCASFMITPGTHLSMADYWRWWVIHLWVEGMFEVFAVVALGLIMASLGLVTRHSAARALRFQLLILLGSGIIGIGHHYYWIGANELWIALGSVFSALEVIPLTLLAVEAWEQWRILKQGGKHYAYRHVFLFLMAVAFWNLFGAGVLGFLINLPIVNYYEHGSFLTANHGHGALMGVFGMLAIALLLWCVRNVVHARGYASRLFTLSFWGLNAGLIGMIAITLTPIGVMQMGEAVQGGFWSARSFGFYQQPAVQTLLWLRVIPDAVFIGLGVVPLVIGLVRAFGNLRPASPVKPAVAGPAHRAPERRDEPVLAR